MQIRLTASIFLAGVIHAPFARAQAPSPATPQFEVASIRPHTFTGAGGGGRLGVSVSGNRITGSIMTLNRLIIYAYDLKNDQISGGPSWAASSEDVYDIAAKAPGDEAPPVDRVRLMFQSLLADRFKLAAHRETRDLPLYELVVAKNGSKLKPHVDDPKAPKPEPGKPPSGGLVMTMPSGGQRRIAVTNRPLATLTSALAAQLGQPVVDKTGLTGAYDYTIEFTPAGPTVAADSDFPSLLVAVQEQLGLKLEPKKAPAEILVIDHAERPSAN
jgi:uncharacterized protein (TIGR03435 family)